VPRGSGNRAAAQRLAASFRQSSLGDHIERVDLGTSRVVVTLRNSPSLWKALIALRVAPSDVPGQQLIQFPRPA